MLKITPLKNFPQIAVGDDLCQIIMSALNKNQLHLKDDDILVVTQKIVSKAEGQYVDLITVDPEIDAIELAEYAGKDPRLVQVILNESTEIIRKRPGVIVTEHRLGFISANAGVDHSNLPLDDEKEMVLCLPKDPDDSAKKIGECIAQSTNVRIGVLIIDSHGRAWRKGTVGITIGTYCVPMLVNKIGDTDMFGRTLRATVIAAADQLAAAAALVMGEANEGTPVVLVRGFPYKLQDESSLKDVFRSKEKDMFR